MTQPGNLGSNDPSALTSLDTTVIPPEQPRKGAVPSPPVVEPDAAFVAASERPTQIKLSVEDRLQMKASMDAFDVEIENLITQTEARLKVLRVARRTFHVLLDGCPGEVVSDFRFPKETKS